jgi:hypothetical protein
VAITVSIAHKDTLVFTSTRPAQAADDEGYFRFAFAVGKEFVDDSEWFFFNLASEEGDNKESVTGATIVDLSTIVAGAKLYDEAVSLLSCAQVAPDN